MKKVYAIWMSLLLVGMLAVVPAVAQPAQGGPDSWGYVWKSDTAFGGPAYEWIDISTRGTVVSGMADDNFSSQLNLGFSFPYYWFNYDKLWVGSNGYVIFDQPRNIASTGQIHFAANPTGGTTASNYIAMFLADLTFVDGNGAPVPNARLLFWTNNTDSAVITFENVPYWTDETPGKYRGSNTFQIVFNKVDSSFKLNYQSASGPANNGQPDATYTSGGNFMVRGFENSSGTIGLSFPINVYPAPNSSIEVRRVPPANPLVFKDLAPEWVINESNTGQILVRGGSPYNLQAKIKNIGTATVGQQPIEVRSVLLDYVNGNNVILRDTFFIPSLTTGQETTITFAKPLSVSTAGIYRVRVEVDAGTEEGNNTANNLRFAEIIVVDTNAKPVVLGYDRFINANAPQFNQLADGFSASFKIGTYFTPPYYPFTVEKLRFLGFARDNSNAYGYEAELVADNNGVPGATLFTGNVSASDAQNSFFFTGFAVPFDINVVPPVTITSGGIFASVILDAPDSARYVYNAICHDEDGPASYRTYEITAGTWAPYRDRAAADFAIHLVGSAAVTSRGPELEAPVFAVKQNFPNPAGDQTTIPFNVVSKGAGLITLHNLAGQVVASYDLGIVQPGRNEQVISTASLAPGVYTYTVRVGAEQQTLRMTVDR